MKNDKTKKIVTAALVGGLAMNIASPAFAADMTMIPNPTTMYEEQVMSKNESRIVVSLPVEKTVYFGSISPGFQPPSQINDTQTVDGITYSGVLYLVPGSVNLTTSSCTADYSGVLYAVI